MSSPDTPQSVITLEFSILPHGLHHLKPNLDYMAKSAKCSLLGHELSNANQSWSVGESRWVGGIILTQIQGQGHGHGILKFVALRKIDRFRQGQRNWSTLSILGVPTQSEAVTRLKL